jgi:predicted ester cyclase
VETSEDLVPRLFRLWQAVPSSDEAARAAFLELYTDPVRINGADVPVDELLLRARRVGSALEGLSSEVLSVVSAQGRTAVAFRMHGRHVGELDTPLGPVSGTGEAVSMQVIDVLTLREGLISEIWMVADQLGLLARLGAVELAPREHR